MTVKETSDEAAELVELLEELHRCATEDAANILTLVRQARAKGLSWRDIGQPLGITTQGAHQRYAHLVGDRDRPWWIDPVTGKRKKQKAPGGA